MLVRILMHCPGKGNKKHGRCETGLQWKVPMEDLLSRSEKKRKSKAVEHLAQELVTLKNRDVAALPCPSELREEISQARGLKSGSLKRQVKYIAKMLRQLPEVTEELLLFLEERRGSQLKEAGEFHELERLRNAIIGAALARHQTAMETRQPWEPDEVEPGSALEAALSGVVERFEGIDAAELRKAAWQFARTRKPVYSREIFRILKGASQRQRFEKLRGADDGV